MGLLAPPAFAEGKPNVTATSLGPNEIQVTGLGFPPNHDVRVSLDLAEPHASIACLTDWTRIVPGKGSAFEFFLAISKRSGCGDLKCAKPKQTAEYVVIAEDLASGQELARAPLLCSVHRR